MKLGLLETIPTGFDTWCPLCSKDTEEIVRGPFYYVQGIPLESHTIAEAKTTEWFRNRHETREYTWYVCEGCCKRNGLIW